MNSWRILRVIFVSLIVAAPLYGHGALRSSSPTKGEHLGQVPREIRLVFTETTELSMSRIMLIGPSGDIELAPLAFAASDSGNILVARIAGVIAVGGAYTVKWQVAGRDGHPVRGEYTFTIAPGSAGLLLDTASLTPTGTVTHHPAVEFPESSGFDVESPLYVFVRWLTFLSLLGIVGAVAFQLVLWVMGRRPVTEHAQVADRSRRRAAKIALGMSGLMLLAAVLRLIAQSYALHGSARAWDISLISSMVRQTNWGKSWMLHVVGAIVAAVGFGIARKGARVGWAIAALGAVTLAFTPGLAGHAASATRFAPVPVVTDAAHIIGAGSWLGSLLYVLFAGIPSTRHLNDEMRPHAVAAMINAFSPTALLFAGVTVTTGVFAAWIHLGTLSALIHSSYGKVLLIKLAVLVGVFGTGAYNFLRVRPALGTDVATGRLQRSAALELTIGVVVLLVTAVLVATATPSTAMTP